MEWAIPPIPMDTRLDLQSGRRRIANAEQKWAERVWGLLPRSHFVSSEGFQDAAAEAATEAAGAAEAAEAAEATEAATSFTLISTADESASILSLQTAVQRFLRQIYIPSGNFLQSATDLPEEVQSVMSYYKKYFKRRVAYTKWSEEYTGELSTETQNSMSSISSLPAQTPWDNAFKYYRWNFTNPSDCRKQTWSDSPAFAFSFHILDKTDIATHASKIEPFQGSFLVNTGIKRIPASNQRFRNGVLMIRFNQAVMYDGYKWNTRDTSDLSGAPRSGWVLQASNDDSVWATDIGAESYLENIQLDSSKWQILHIVGCPRNPEDLNCGSSMIPENLKYQNIPTSPFNASGEGLEIFSNQSRKAMARHLKLATELMITLYINNLRQQYVKLPGTIQNRIAGCYVDVEKDTSSVKSGNLNSDQVNTLIEKYIHSANVKENTVSILPEDESRRLVITPMPNGFVNFTVASDLDLVPGMFAQVTGIDATPDNPKTFNGFIYSYLKANGSLDISQISDIRGTFSTIAAYNIKTYFYKGRFELGPITFLEGTTLNATGVVNTEIASRSLSYSSGNAVLVRNATTPTNSFEATVGTYDKVAKTMTLTNVKNNRGSFRQTASYTIEPIQTSCLAKLRDEIKQELEKKMDTIFTTVSGCESNEGKLLTVSKTAESVTVEVKKPPANPLDPPTTGVSITLNPTTDRNAVNANPNNVTLIIDTYEKYNRAFEIVIKANVIGEGVQVVGTETVGTSETLGLFQDTSATQEDDTFPKVLLLQIKRMINALMRNFYDEYHFDKIEVLAAGSSIANGFGRVIMKPVNYSDFYEPELANIFKLDSTIGQSEILRDYNILWNSGYNSEAVVSGEKYKGIDIFMTLRLKYTTYATRLLASKKLAKNRKETIQAMELFETYYSMISSVISTLVIKIPSKATRDNERLFIAPNSTNVDELIALRDKYYDYIYTNTFMDRYDEISNDLWSCAEKAIVSMKNEVVTLYETRDPTPQGEEIVLAEWRRTEVDNTGVNISPVISFFLENEIGYRLPVENRPSVIYMDISGNSTVRNNYITKLVEQRSKTESSIIIPESLETEIENVWANPILSQIAESLRTLRGHRVLRKAEAGRADDVENVANTANYTADLQSITALQEQFLRLLNAKEVLDPFQEANKPMGLLRRTREGIQIDRIKTRLNPMILYYKRMYEAVRSMELNGYLWDRLFWQYDLSNPTQDGTYTYIIYASNYDTNVSNVEYNVSKSGATTLLSTIKSICGVTNETEITLCTKEDLQQMVNCNVNVCKWGWVSDSDVRLCPSSCENATIGEVRQFEGDTSDGLGVVYLKLTTKRIIHFYNRLNTTNNRQISFQFATNTTDYNPAESPPNYRNKIEFNPPAIYETFKVIDPSNLPTTSTGYADAPDSEYDSWLDFVRNTLTGVNDTSNVENTLLDAERNYTGAFSSLINYTQKLFVQVFAQINAMHTAYTTHIQGHSGEFGGFEKCSSIDVDAAFINSLSFSIDNDTAREESYQKLDQFLDTRGACDIPGVASRRDATYTWSAAFVPVLVRQYIDKYNTMFRQVFAYEYRLAETKMMIGRQFVEYHKIHRTASAETTGSVKSGKLLKDAIRTDDPYTSETLTLTTAKARMNTMKTVWIDPLMDTIWSRLNTFYGNIRTFQAKNAEPWYTVGISDTNRTTLTNMVAFIDTYSKTDEKWKLTVPDNDLYKLPIADDTNVLKTLIEADGVMDKFKEYYTTMLGVKAEVDIIKNESKLSYNSSETVTSLNSNISIDTTGYKTLDYLLVGGGGGGTSGGCDTGNGGGGSGFFKSSLVGDEFGVSDEVPKILNNNTLDISQTSVTVKIGPGGGANTKGASTTLKINDTLTIEAEGGNPGSGNNGGTGGNNGGNGAGKDGTSGAGATDYGGTGGAGVFSGSQGALVGGCNDSSGGGGGGGIGSGSGGRGATTHQSGVDGEDGEDYTGAGGGGGAFFRMTVGGGSNVVSKDGRSGGHGFAIIVLNAGVNLTDADKCLLSFLKTTYASTSVPQAGCAAGFQNQRPYNPQEIRRKIMAQRLNTITFAPSESPTPLQGFFAPLFSLFS